MGRAWNLSRTPLLLNEMDAALRSAERASAGSGTPDEVRRHFTAHVRSGKEPRDFFHKELEDYHKAHDDYRAAKQAARDRTDSWENTGKRLHAAWDGMKEKGQTLAAKAHATDHPVGQYLDYGHEKARIQTDDLHLALHHVSHDPSKRPGHGYGSSLDTYSGQRSWLNADEKSARHLEHALKAHGLHTGMRRGQRDPHLVFTGGQ